jgi:hypothetical protein
MTSWRDRMQALKPEETERQRDGSQEGQGGWGAFSREPKNQGPSIAQAVKAAADSVVAKAAIIEKRKYEEAVNLTSEKAYPSLGVSVQPKVALNYGGVVKAALAKAALAEDEEEQPQTKSHERPKEKAKAKAPIVNFETFMDSSDESEEEYNAETVQDRRRGDKGIW